MNPLSEVAPAYPFPIVCQAAIQARPPHTGGVLVPSVIQLATTITEWTVRSCLILLLIRCIVAHRQMTCGTGQKRLSHNDYPCLHDTSAAGTFCGLGRSRCAHKVAYASPRLLGVASSIQETRVTKRLHVACLTYPRQSIARVGP